MKYLIYVAFFFLFLEANLLAQSYIEKNDPCVTLRPGSLDGKDAFVHGLFSQVNINYGGNNQLAAMTWTFQGVEGTVRGLIEFDLTSIPSGSVITSAALSLYGIGDNSGFGGHSDLSGSNEAWIQRVTSFWDEGTVTWNTQPSSTSVNQVALNASTVSNEDYIDLDVTALVQDMLTFGNNGFMIKMQDENYYRRLNFASSDNSNAELHPQLVVCYQLPLVDVNVEQANEFGFSIYPNPAHERTIIELNDLNQLGSSLTLRDSQGKILHSSTFNSSALELTTANFENGVYFISVESDNGIVTKQLVIAR